MAQIQCPHCAFVMIDDGDMPGALVACPSCGNHFHMPGFAPIETPISAPPLTIRHASRRPAGQRARRHWTKRAMIGVTILWLVGTPVLGMAAYMHRRGEFRDESHYVESELGFHSRYSGAFYSHKEVELTATASFFAVVIMGASTWPVAMGVLVVIWFASRPD